MKKILIPVDFSENSEVGLQVGAELAKKHRSKICIIHMVGIMQEIVVRREEKTAMEVEYQLNLAREDMNVFLDKEYLKGLNVESIVTINKSFSQLPEYARAFGADLIVMSSHGAKGIKEILIGSNTEKVIRHTNIPILVVKQRSSPSFNPRSLVFGLDLEVSVLPALKQVYEFCKQLDAELKLVYINTPGMDFETTEELEGLISDFKKAVTKHLKFDVGNIEVYNDHTVENGLQNYMSNINADALVVATRGKKGLAHYFSHSIGESVANHANVPVLVVKR